MKNIWFLRTDKDKNGLEFDLSENYQFIYSDHGTCRKNYDVEKYKKNIFPKLLVKGKELRKIICEIKKRLIENRKINHDDEGKTQCDLFISYWVTEMMVGDIVFVRNKKQEVFLCEITGYIEEKFFDSRGSFQRPVKILEKISSNTQELKSMFHRTSGRRTLERNANSGVAKTVSDYLILKNFVSKKNCR